METGRRSFERVYDDCYGQRHPSERSSVTPSTFTTPHGGTGRSTRTPRQCGGSWRNVADYLPEVVAYLLDVTGTS